MRGTIDDVRAGRATWCAEQRDGFALAREIHGKTVDHVIGDPPYDDQTHEGMRTMKDKGEASTIDFAALPPIDTFLPALILCARRWTILFCTGAMLGDYKREAGGRRDDGGAWIRDGYWHRTNSAPQITGDRPAAGCEAIAVMHARGGRMRWNRGGDQAFWEGPICRDALRIHKTKKPAWLMEALIRDFTDPGDLILDPTMGEGTTGEACLRLGRRFIGCEIADGIDKATGVYDPKRDYFAAAVRRLERAEARGVQGALLSTDPIPRAKQVELLPTKPGSAS